jgi:predicted ATPase
MLRFTNIRTSTLLCRFFSITTVQRKAPSQVYYDRVNKGEIRKDHRQEVVLKKLDQLYNHLQNYNREKVESIIQAKIAPRTADTEQSSGWFSSKQPKVASTTNAIAPHPAELPQSVYLYGIAFSKI